MRNVRSRPVSRRSFFTLIEIMIVVVIIGMIMTLVGPNVIRKFKGAQRKTAVSQIKLLGNAADDYYLDLSAYPSKLEDLITNPGNQKWDGPYLKPARIPKDPWGNDYHYQAPGQHGSEYDIYSYGADGSPGGQGDAADVNSWE